MHQPRPRFFRAFLVLLIVSLPVTTFASGGEHGPGPEVWLSIAAILLAAKAGGEIAVRLRQPAVLGELCAGIILGNLTLVGVDTFADAAELPAVEFLANFGVVLLLFEVGLESTLTEMKKVAPQSGLVAIIGVVAPMGLGYGASRLLMPDAVESLHLFVGATLCATSVGITARVLQGLDAMGRDETKVILGAAVIDDVLGLIVLAVVAGLAAGGEIDATQLAMISGLAAGFLIGALLLGTFVMPGVFLAASHLRSPGILAAVAIGLCLLLAGVSAAAGLAPIVGAFAAGLILDEVHVKPFGKHSKHDLAPLVQPIVGFMAPIFFVRTGMLVDLGGVSADPLILAGALTVVAVLGKIVSGLGVRGKIDRMTVGVGMVPRGEVGLIFADVGRAIRVDGGAPLIGPDVYMAVVLMVMGTTVLAPPWLAWQLRRVLKRERAAGAHGAGSERGPEGGPEPAAGHADDPGGPEHAAPPARGDEPSH
ncbi:MAG: cation:proton antiporter [Myxococcales bacterium]|nr:cation:proton antiporter [Myxococcales bacterium]